MVSNKMEKIKNEILKIFYMQQHIKKTKLSIEDEYKYSSNFVPESKDALYGKIRLIIHNIEKNIVKGNIPKKDGVFSLISFTEKLIKKYPDYPKSGDAVIETIGIVRTVINTGKISNEDYILLENELNRFILENNLENVTPQIINIQNIKDKDKPTNISVQYDDIVKSRHSIRNYTTDIVEEKLLKDIVRIALICPSACNRQPCKVYYTKEPEKIREFFPDKWVTKDVYNLLIVTVNKSFYSIGELYQPWIDGGIFIESLIMAIHSRGLGACLFQYLKSNNNYTKFKETVNIPENEDIVCCVGLGYLLDDYCIIETHRKKVDEMMVEY